MDDNHDASNPATPSAEIQPLSYERQQRRYEPPASDFVMSSLIGVFVGVLAMVFTLTGVAFVVLGLSRTIDLLLMLLLPFAMFGYLAYISLRCAWRNRRNVRRSNRPRETDAFFVFAFQLTYGVLAMLIFFGIGMILVEGIYESW